MSRDFWISLAVGGLVAALAGALMGSTSPVAALAGAFIGLVAAIATAAILDVRMRR